MLGISTAETVLLETLLIETLVQDTTQCFLTVKFSNSRVSAVVIANTTVFEMLYLVIVSIRN